MRVYKAGDKVLTDYGVGTIVSREAEKGYLSHRYLIKLDNFDSIPEILVEGLKDVHKEFSGLCFFDNEFELRTKNV